MTDSIDDQPKTVPAPQPPDSQVVMGGTGDGTRRQQLMETPQGQPDVMVHFVPTALAVLVRFADTFLTILVAAIGAGATTNIIPADDVVSLLGKCGSLALGGAIIGMLKDLIVIAGKLKRKFPLLDV